MFELIVTLGDRQVQKYRGSGDVVVIGRDPSCDVVLDNLGVSRRHAEIRQIEGRYVLADKGSTNGVYMGDRRITSTELSAETTFRIAKFSLRFRPVERETPESFDINQTIALSTEDLGGKAAGSRAEYVASVTRDVFHRKGCAWIKATPDDHKVWFDTAQEAWDSGRRACKTCDPAATAPRTGSDSGPDAASGPEASRQSEQTSPASSQTSPASSRAEPARPSSTVSKADSPGSKPASTPPPSGSTSSKPPSTSSPKPSTPASPSQKRASPASSSSPKPASPTPSSPKPSSSPPSSARPSSSPSSSGHPSTAGSAASGSPAGSSRESSSPKGQDPDATVVSRARPEPRESSSGPGRDSETVLVERPVRPSSSGRSDASDEDDDGSSTSETKSGSGY